MTQSATIVPNIPLSAWYDETSADSVEEDIVQLIMESFAPDDRHAFLQPSLEDIPDPELLKGVTLAVELLLEAVSKNKKILIVGDYDVDGITSTVLLTRFLQKMDYLNFESFIPNRFIHGYGLTSKSVDEILLKNPDLVITVDNGITAKNEIDRIQTTGATVIVTDHHLPQDDALPDCVIINPKQQNCSYPFKDLSGVGVVFVFLIAVRTALRKQHSWKEGKEPNLLHHLDLVAIGTIADQVPLLGVNRLFAKYGLDQMTKRIHQNSSDEFFHYLKVFAERTHIRFFDSNCIAFRLAPMLNATGRMKDAMAGVGFLMSETEQIAISRYNYIERLNLKRRKKQKTMVKMAVEKAHSLVEQKQGLLVYDNSFHEGLIGIVASRLSDQFNQPSIVVSDSEPGVLKASARTKNENMMEILQECEMYLERFGGHVNAAGFSIKKDNLEKFHHLYTDVCTRIMSNHKSDVFKADIEVKLEMLTQKFIDRLKMFEPFGQENKKTIFMLQGQSLPLPIIMTGKHLKWILKPDLEMIYWNGAVSADYDSRFNIAFTLSENYYRGEKKRQLIVDAMVPS
ncbi:MAG: single-stranded-DNA-specific exonuclease RecJ [Deltaproteobacteria bacterium]|nr:single-stranded-DNA-specific exonuclease RecJ [Deltaproteobacteria bacterium]